MPMLEKVIKLMKNSKGFDVVLEKVKIVSAGNGSCTAELKIENEHVNPAGSLHTGLAVTLVDVISGYALCTLLHELVHVSVNLDLSYVRTAALGNEVIIDARMVNMDKTMAHLEVELRNKETGVLLIKGSHTKFITDQKLLFWD